MKQTWKFFSLVVLLLMIAITIIHYNMAKTPLQPFKALKEKNGIEFRFYPEAVMATVSSAGNTYTGNSNKNFRVLAGYIFGNNEQKNKIAMTAPVYMSKDEEKSTMSFVMPEGYTLENLPVPATGEIKLHASQEEYVAAIRFGGYASDVKIEEKKKELHEALTVMGITHNKDFRYLGYNAPWDFLFRRNEVMVSIPKVAADKLK